MQPEKDVSASKVSRARHSAVAPESRGRAGLLPGQQSRFLARREAAIGRRMRPSLKTTSEVDGAIQSGDFTASFSRSSSRCGLALIPRGFETLRCQTILGVADTANIASLRLCEKVGMRHKRDTIRYGCAARVLRSPNCDLFSVVMTADDDP
jgi:hypothetical protein